MIYEMMIMVDFQSIKNVGRNPRGLHVKWVTKWVTKWVINPSTIYSTGSLCLYIVLKNFIMPDPATQYIAVAILLDTAPCTLMVFVCSLGQHSLNGG